MSSDSVDQALSAALHRINEELASRLPRGTSYMLFIDFEGDVLVITNKLSPVLLETLQRAGFITRIEDPTKH